MSLHAYAQKQQWCVAGAFARPSVQKRLFRTLIAAYAAGQDVYGSDTHNATHSCMQVSDWQQVGAARTQLLLLLL